MKNQVIEVIDQEHGRKVIDYWKSQGVDTSCMLRIGTKKDGYTFRYYGVIDGCFGAYSEKEAAENNAEIIELPTESHKEEKTFPRVMLVSNDGKEWYKRVVFMQKCDRFLAWSDAETIEESECIYRIASWRYAKELPEKVELTKSEIAEKFGVSVDQLVIKDD